MRIHLFDPGHRPALLIAAAEGPLARALDRSLREEGFAPHLANSAAEATRCRGQVNPAAWVIDANLDGGRGLEYVRGIRAGGDATPVLFLNGLGDKAGETDASAAGADLTLLKPFSLDELRAHVRRALPPEKAAGLGAAPVAGGRRRPSFHLFVLLVPLLLALGAAATYWLLNL